MRMLHPDYHVKRAQDIDLNLLKKKGIKLIIFDIDNTLALHNGKKPAEGILKWIKTVQKEGFLCCMVSNNKRKRVDEFNRFFDFYTIPRAMKPLRRAFLRAAKRMEVKPNEACVVGDQLFSDILGANCAKMTSILVDRLSDADEGGFIRFKRKIEKHFL